jgi:dTDP-4-dehydrorhamnose 3,5-epimerase
MKFRKTFIEGPVEFIPNKMDTGAGEITITFNQVLLDKNGFNYRFVQENQLNTNMGNFSGIHCQMPPYTQGKLIRVVTGKIIAYAIDLRRSSDTYGKWESVILDGNKSNIFFIPPGFGSAHFTLENNTIIMSKNTNLYSSEHEVVIDYKDPNISLPINKLEDLIVSEKDKKGVSFMEFNKDNPW